MDYLGLLIKVQWTSKCSEKSWNCQIFKKDNIPWEYLEGKNQSVLWNIMHVILKELFLKWIYRDLNIIVYRNDCYFIILFLCYTFAYEIASS